MKIDNFICDNRDINDVISKISNIAKDLEPFKDLFLEEINNLLNIIKINKNNISDFCIEKERLK